MLVVKWTPIYPFWTEDVPLAMAKYKDLWRGGGTTNRSAHEEVEGGATTRCAQGGPE